MKFRWREPKKTTAVEFEVEHLADFRDALLGALIDYRIASRKGCGGDYHYPAGILEVYLPTGAWCQPKPSNYFEDADIALKIPTRGALESDDSAPKDVDIIDDSFNNWFLQCKRLHDSAEHNLSKNKGKLKGGDDLVSV